MLTPGGELHLDIPRDRLASFEPKLVAKHQRRMPGFDDHVISVRDIQGHLLDLYGTQVSPDLISTITDEVLDEVTQWQQRPLESMYPIVYFDALRLKIRDDGTVKNKAAYLALGIRADGKKEVLGLWIEQTEGAKFWLKVFNELKNRVPSWMACAVSPKPLRQSMRLRKIVKNRGHFPSDDAATKLLFLALRNIEKDWI